MLQVRNFSKIALCVALLLVAGCKGKDEPVEPTPEQTQTEDPFVTPGNTEDPHWVRTVENDMSSSMTAIVKVSFAAQPGTLAAFMGNDCCGVGSADNLDYDLLLVCANWPGSRHEAWTTLLKARAIENLCYVLGCNRSGVDGVGGKYTGNSALIDYKGFPLAEAKEGADQTVAVTLDKEKLDTFRQHWPFHLDFD